MAGQKWQQELHGIMWDVVVPSHGIKTGRIYAPSDDPLWNQPRETNAFLACAGTVFIVVFFARFAFGAPVWLSWVIALALGAGVYPYAMRAARKPPPGIARLLPSSTPFPVLDAGGKTAIKRSGEEIVSLANQLIESEPQLETQLRETLWDMARHEPKESGGGTPEAVAAARQHRADTYQVIGNAYAEFERMVSQYLTADLHD